MPPTDPRYLEATEEEILHDCLVRRAHFEHAYRLNHPREAALLDALENPKVQTGLDAWREELMRNAGKPLIDGAPAGSVPKKPPLPKKVLVTEGPRKGRVVSP